jgi:hypothetical protein
MKNSKAIGIHIGDVTQTQDQSITPVNLSINRIRVMNGSDTEQPDFLLDIF